MLRRVIQGAAVIAISVLLGLGARALARLIADPTVDITFSLDCRALEGNIGQTLFGVPTIEGLSDEDNDEIIDRSVRDRFYAHYDLGARLAFSHGVVDDSSIFIAGGMHVVEATPEHIELRRLTYSGGNVYPATGDIDRRTGVASIQEYLPDEPTCRSVQQVLDDMHRQKEADDIRHRCDSLKVGLKPSGFISLYRQVDFKCKSAPRALFSSGGARPALHRPRHLA